MVLFGGGFQRKSGRDMMKIGVIGAAGCIGSSIAFNITTKGLADEIVLADIR